jgi:hypothetical protein
LLHALELQAGGEHRYMRTAVATKIGPGGT